MKVLHVVGARPHFPKLAPLYRALARRGHDQIIVHTGQHYDLQMSALFFDELELPPPRYCLDVGSAGHGAQTGHMLVRLEPVLLEELPDIVLVYGDTNSTLAGALAAAKLGLKVGHIEAGLRSHVQSMPEEINRILTDHCAHLLFCPTETAVRCLAQEGITSGVYLVGDVMYDALQQFLPLAEQRKELLPRLGLEPKRYLLVTVHRAANTDDPARLTAIVAALNQLEEPVLFPVHPRTAVRLRESGLALAAHIRTVEPLGYLDMLLVERNARRILTDSGGVQKEAYLLGTPCVTLREETEWPETLSGNWNTLAGVDATAIKAAVRRPEPVTPPPPRFGDGQAAKRIVAVLEQET